MVITGRTLAAGTKVNVYSRGADEKIASVASEVIEEGREPGWAIVDIAGDPVRVPVMDLEKAKVRAADVDERGFEVEGAGRVLVVLGEGE